MSNFSINDKMSSKIAEEETQMNVTPTAEYGPVNETKEPKVHLENIEAYKLAVSSMRNELIGLVNEGHMLESVAEKILTDFMHNTFNQLVKLRFE